MVSIEEVVRDNLVVVVGSMREGAAAVAIPQCPDAGHVRLQLIINHYVAAVIGGDSSPVQSQVVRVGDTSHRQKNVSADYFWWTLFACEAHVDAAIAFPQRDTFRTEPDLHPLSLQNFPDRLRDVVPPPSPQARSHSPNGDVPP